VNAQRDSGLFVALEGGDGAGKSTQVDLLVSALRERGHEVIQTREPGGTSVGKRIREILLDSKDSPTSKSEALLFAADRAQHAAEVIRPALARGAIVVSDRYLLSSIAYQGFARNLGPEKIAEISHWATDDLAPDLTILLEVEPKFGLARAKDRNRMEAESAEFHNEVARGFKQYATNHPERFIVLDANQEVDALALVILNAVENRL
jgi:dTMP kinase